MGTLSAIGVWSREWFVDMHSLKSHCQVTCLFLTQKNKINLVKTLVKLKAGGTAGANCYLGHRLITVTYVAL